MFDSDEDSAFVILTPPMYYTYHGYREGVICPLVTTNLPTRVIVKDMEVRYTERNLVCAFRKFHKRIVQIFERPQSFKIKPKVVAPERCESLRI